MATESLAPVAAITDLILGTLTIVLANRAVNHDPHKRFTALLFGWTFIFIGAYYTIVSVIELGYPDKTFGWSLIQFGVFESTGVGVYDALVFMLFGLQSAINILTLALALHLPFDLGSGRNWNSMMIGSIGVYCVVVPIIVIFGGFSITVFQSVMILATSVIWTMIYVRGLLSEMLEENDAARSASKGAGLLLIAFYSPSMIWWLSTVMMGNNEWFSGVLSQFSESASVLYLLGVNTIWVAGLMPILVLLFGEGYRTFKKGTSLLSIVVFVVVVIGFINYFIDVALSDVLVSCYETECQDVPVAFTIWSGLTTDVLAFLFVPLLFVYVLIQYRLVESSSDENRNLLRIMILLLILIVSSSFIELVQSLIPIPQMVTASLLAIAVAFFIGWEEKITGWFVQESVDGETVTGDTLLPQSLSKFTVLMSVLLVYIISVSWLFANMGVGL